MTKENKRTVSSKRCKELIELLETRFEKNKSRHKNLDWKKIEAKIDKNSEKLWSLNEMENTGGEPDVIGYDKEEDEYLFCDCSPESPKGRRSVCYDQEALEARKKNKPENSAVNMAAEMGVELLTKEQYEELQKLGDFDMKTSSWVKTPLDMRELGGALFCDSRFGYVFTYHNGADSYYASRGFRSLLRV